jgi:hypothetical protein
MTSLKDLKATAVELIEKHPQHRDEILDFYHLAVSEVEEGGSEAHECSLAYNDMINITGE